MLLRLPVPWSLEKGKEAGMTSVARQGGRRPWILLIVSLIAVLAIAGAAVWWSTRDGQLSLKPPRSGPAADLPASQSSVQARATIAVSTISDAVNAAVPSSFRLEGRQKVCAQLTEEIKQTIQKKVGGDVGRILGEVTKFVTEVVTVDQAREVCQDVDYHVDINRDSALQVSTAADHLHIELPISASGQAGFSGDVAKALALDKKNFRGALIAFADISFDLTQDWCPQLTAAADFAWTNTAEFEIVHNWWIDIDGQVGPKLKDMIGAALGELQKKIRCEDVKQAVSPIWHAYSLPIAGPGASGPVAFVNIAPVAIGFSGIEYGPDALSAAFGITAQTNVSTNSAKTPSQAIALPPLQRIAKGANDIELTVPVRIDYGDIAKAWSNYFGAQTFRIIGPAGRIDMAIDALEVYPSEGHLAVGMHFTTKIGNQLLETTGWVYVVGEPVLDPAGQILRLSELRFTRQLDNRLWELLSVVLDGPIRSALEEKASYDLKPAIARLQGELAKELAKLKETHKLAIDRQSGFVGLNKVNVADKALDVEVSFKGTANIAIGSLALGK
ncbi:DUF4403 family protein [Agrobacterium tumefaciens]|uniref:DUF4403 family protein n=1 Tax=Agrobacterium tumefaciens TaxID=358 RepID=UPI00135E9BFE|nr:DUF4403 family protein [Agrobacterium tumefaciens]